MVFADILVTMASALDCDVLVAGGGPAGLAIVIAARMNGLSAIVIERHPSHLTRLAENASCHRR